MCVSETGAIYKVVVTLPGLPGTGFIRARHALHIGNNAKKNK